MNTCYNGICKNEKVLQVKILTNTDRVDCIETSGVALGRNYHEKRIVLHWITPSKARVGRGHSN